MLLQRTAHSFIIIVIIIIIIISAFRSLVIVLQFRFWDLGVKGFKVEGKQLLPIGRYEVSSIQLKCLWLNKSIHHLQDAGG